MKLVTGFAILAVCQGHHINPECDDVVVQNISYEKEVLVKNKDIPYQLAVDYNSNRLFFSYFDINNNLMSTSSFVNLKTGKQNTIPGIYDGFANTVDNTKNIVYLGGGDGLYKFNNETKTATHIEGTSHNIWQMFFKDNVYYSEYPNEKAYVFKNGKSEIVPELANTKAMLLALNNDLDFYFVNYTGLYKLDKSSGETLLLGDYDVNAITADIKGNLYFSTFDAIYFINEKDKIDKIVSIPYIYGVAIENNGNIIYTTHNAIVRLKPTQTPCRK